MSRAIKISLAFLLALPLLGAADSTAPADLLTAGKIEYANGNHDKAVDLLRQLTKQDSTNAEAHLWLGRALGRKAENSNPLRAAFLVGDIKRAFERAVELAPRNDDRSEERRVGKECRL